MIEPTLGSPVENGIYAARQYYGWRILEWHEGQWWHVGRSAKFPHYTPGNQLNIEAFVGPLPTISIDYSKPAPHRGANNRVPQTVKAAMEYDL